MIELSDLPDLEEVNNREMKSETIDHSLGMGESGTRN